LEKVLDTNAISTICDWLGSFVAFTLGLWVYKSKHLDIWPNDSLDFPASGRFSLFLYVFYVLQHKIQAKKAAVMATIVLNAFFLQIHNFKLCCYTIKTGL